VSYDSPSPNNISGAIYSSVPSKESVFNLSSALEIPKSLSFIFSSLSKSIFSGFISLCIIGSPRLCKYSKTSINYKQYFLTYDSVNLLLFSTKPSFKVPLETRAMIK